LITDYDVSTLDSVLIINQSIFSKKGPAPNGFISGYFSKANLSFSMLNLPQRYPHDRIVLKDKKILCNHYLSPLGQNMFKKSFLANIIPLTANQMHNFFYHPFYIANRIFR